MDDLILRSLEGPLSDVEKRRLDEWRATSAGNDRHYRDLVWLAGALDTVGRTDQGAAPPPPPAGAIIHRSRPDEARPGNGRWFRLAAAAAVIATAGLVGYEAGAVQRVDLPFSARELTTGAAESSTMSLADGSFVRVGADSRLVIGQPDQREVWLDGTAFFAIAKQDGKPFVVRTPAGSATVLGTRFEIKTERDRLRVVVVEGKVTVRNDAGRVDLTGGQMTFADRGTPPAVSQVADPTRMVGWVGRVLLFNDTRLDQVAAEIADRYPVKVVITDSSLAGHQITGTFPNQPIDQLTATICRVVDASCSIATDTIWISPKQ